jgi:hypothetical protein
MKNTLRYIFAIPIAIIISMILPKWFIFISNYFIPFEFIIQFIENYLIKFIAGWITVSVTIIIVPKRRVLFGALQLVLNLIGAIYMYKINNDFNYMFLIGGIIGLYLGYLVITGQNKELADEARKVKYDTDFKDIPSKLDK